MKKISALFMMATLFSATAFADGENFGATNVSTSNCKYYYSAPTRTVSVEDGEWIDYSVEKREDGFVLHIVHENIYFNCATLGAECSAKLEGNVLTLEEHEKPGSEMADCICPYDVTYDVGPLQEGVYTVIITMRGYKLAEFSVYITESYRNRFSVDAYVTKIESAMSEIPKNEVVYDLLGRCYASFPFPGIFIKGGKKIVWKGQ